MASGPNRLEKGRFSSISGDTFFWGADDFTSTIGDSVVTVTVSWSVPTSSVTGRLTVSPSWTRTFSRWRGLNPDNSNVTAYTPGVID